MPLEIERIIEVNDPVYTFHEVSRKNFLFANTPMGAQSSAVIFSLIETAKENKLDPYRYLVWVLRTAPTLDRTKDEWAKGLLPRYAPNACSLNGIS